VNAARWLMLLSLLIVLILTANGTLMKMAAGFPRSGQYVARFWPLSWDRLPSAVDSAWYTLKMSIYGTVLAFLTAIPLAHLASRNITPSTAVYLATRCILTIMRGLPAVVLGIMFVAAVGLGETAGILSLWFHTTGVFGKYMSEAFEVADQDTLDAAAVDGASRWQSYSMVLIPMQANAIVSFVMYYIEANFRHATVLGIVGAGGIGMELATSVGLFKYGWTGVLILTIATISLSIDLLSRFVRSKLQ